MHDKFVLRARNTERGNSGGNAIAMACAFRRVVYVVVVDDDNDNDDKVLHVRYVCPIACLMQCARCLLTHRCADGFQNTRASQRARRRKTMVEIPIYIRSTQKSHPTRRTNSACTKLRRIRLNSQHTTYIEHTEPHKARPPQPPPSLRWIRMMTRSVGGRGLLGLPRCCCGFCCCCGCV